MLEIFVLKVQIKEYHYMQSILKKSTFSQVDLLRILFFCFTVFFLVDFVCFALWSAVRVILNSRDFKDSYNFWFFKWRPKRPFFDPSYVKAVYCHPAYLIYMQSTSLETLGWRKHELESRLLGEISITSDMQQMTPPLWQKVKKN